MNKIQEMTNDFHKKKYPIKIITITSIAIPLFIALTSVFSGEISLWYDNARDLLSAWGNLSKLTLIGPPSGIPGIFYGPYWIWLLSFGLLFSKDPRIVTFITATIPYLFIFPFIWFQLSKVLGIKAVLISWILFIFTNGMLYATQLWNPYPAPLIAIIIIFLLLRINFNHFSYKTTLLTVSLGFLVGILINFHISFGIGFTLGVSLFLLWEMFCETVLVSKSKKVAITRINYLFVYGIGIFFAFIPFFLFEYRHGFNQMTVITHTLGEYGNVVDVKGLTKLQILQEFNNTFAKLIHVPSILATTILVLSLGLFTSLILQKKIQVTRVDARIIALVISLFSGVGVIYFTAKNPVWAYHFIGVDILFLIFITFLLAKISLLKKLSLIWILYISITNIFSFIVFYTHHRQSMLDNQKEIVRLIFKDANNSNFVVLAYSPSIYTYEYTYLFKWLVKKDVPFDPSQNPPHPKTAYLIIPPNRGEAIQNFIDYRSPKILYKTGNVWKTTNGTEIIKRIQM